MREAWQEARDLGPRDLAYRVGWEARLRLGLLGIRASIVSDAEAMAGPWPPRIGFAPAKDVRDAMRDRLSPAERAALVALAERAGRGRILHFGKWLADCGRPMDWHRDPITGEHWPAQAHWTRSLSGRGDIKLVWEMARFPHAFHLARAAALEAAVEVAAAKTLTEHVSGFIATNPAERGPHWSSSQEIALRAIAWCFALGVLGEEPGVSSLRPAVRRALVASGAHVARFLEYSRNAVRNNHLIAEALLLYLLPGMLGESSRTKRWEAIGRVILDAEAERQFYPDGGYILQSHNYERGALQYYLLAMACARSRGESVPKPWLAAADRALLFLHDQQEPISGQLPNYGANDGSLPAILSTCDRSDFRSTLQAASVAVRGERLYPPGPWDEETAWLFGAAALDAPLHGRTATSVYHGHSGHAVLRGNEPGTFATFRCGSIRDRYSQMDMLHLDLWWRGHNVLADPGTFSYHDETWHRHFQGTESHNTLMVDGHDQMTYRRRFKNVFWTKARLLHFHDTTGWALVIGEHDGFKRYAGGCVHRRSVLMVKDMAWIVVDQIDGIGEHRVRWQWLAGPYARRDGSNGIELQTPAGPFHVSAFDRRGETVSGRIVRGASDPPRGWLSRYYGQKAPTASLVIERLSETTPLVTVASATPVASTVRGSAWSISVGAVDVTFEVAAGGIAGVEVG